MRGLMQQDAAAEALLGWWSLAGVDAAVREEPVNWLRPAPAAVPRAQKATGVSAMIATMPDSLAGFQLWLDQASDQPESGWPGPRFRAEGDAGAPLMVITDVADNDDVATGRLLSGEAGQLFDAMLAAIGLSRAQIYLTSLAFARPIGGLLSPDDYAPLATRMRRHISLAQPKRVLLLGDKTSSALMSTDGGVSGAKSENGLHALNHDGGIVEAIGASHPRFLLRQAAGKAECWRALQNLIGGSQS